jgi:exosortase
MFSTSVAAALLNGIGIAVRRSGTIVHAMEERGVDFNVADPCSGLRSLLAMMALVSAYAYLTQRTPARKWALFLLSIPIAMAGNTLRIVTVAVVGRFAGREMALRLYHDYSGYVVFAVCVSLMVTFGVALSRFRMEVMRAWMRGWVRRTEP